jgi:hypothetical protein
MATLRMISGKYDIDLDSRIAWSIEASGFEPLAIRFELDRSEILQLLSTELYEDDPLAFIRELLQNSVDALDARQALFLQNAQASLDGEIRVRIDSTGSGLSIEWNDNGIGMDEDILSSFFARLGQSWYRSREALRLGEVEPISQFGVGILSCFAISDKLTVETLRDPQIGGSRSGLFVDIPTRESHFRIRKTNSTRVGTTIRLDVRKSLRKVVSKEAICGALVKIARYVRHKVTIDSDGLVVHSGLSQSQSNAAVGRTYGDTDIVIAGMRGTAAEKLSATTTTVAFEIGDPSADYHGHYAAVVPTKPHEVRRTIDSSVWYMGSEEIELDDVLVNTEQALYVKGIKTGPVMPNASRRQSQYGGPFLSPYTSWIPPTLLLNVRKPSQVRFNLARSSVHFRSDEWMQPVWREIAHKFSARAFSESASSAGARAIRLGSCAIFGGLPESALAALVETSEIPLLVLGSGKGAIWTTIGEFARRDEFVEAPYELGYSTRKDFRGFGRDSELQGWGGEDALFPIEGLNSDQYPWLAPVLAFGHRALGVLGWHPAAISLVNPPAGDTVPLVCVVWKNTATDPEIKHLTERFPRIRRQVWGLSPTSVNFYEDGPELLRFPTSASKYAAIGSRYWNINHPKITKIVAVLGELTERHRQQRLSLDNARVFEYVTSKTFIGYVVPSRKSGDTLAMQVPNRLLDLAEKVGLPIAERLLPGDFFPGSIGTYENPYHYSLAKWGAAETGLGQSCDT